MKTRKKHPGGRPRKFATPSRPITVTLPESTLQHLHAIDPDRARAIVRATDIALQRTQTPPPTPEIVNISPDLGLIVVGPCSALRRIPWIRLIEIAPLRFIISVPTGISTDSLEVALNDLLDSLPRAEERDLAILRQLLALLRRVRRGRMISREELIVVSLDADQRGKSTT